MAQVTILKYSQIDKSNIGADYYHPDKLKAVIKLNKFDTKVGDLFLSTKNLTSEFKEENLFVNLNDVHNGFIDNFDTAEFKSSKKRAVFGDVIISKLRPYLREIAFYNGKKDVLVSTEFLVLHEKKPKGNLKFLLLPFLFSKYVQTILFWGQCGTNHPRFKEKDLLNLGLPLANKDKIKKLVLDACEKYAKSKELYKSAVESIVKEIKVDRKNLGHDLTFIKKSSELKNNNRWDADFHQPKYDRLAKCIKEKSNKKIEEVQLVNRRGVQPNYDDEGNVLVVTSKFLGKEFIDYQNLLRIDFNQWKDTQRAQIKKNDILIYTTGAYIGRTNSYLIADKAMASNHVNILRVKDINPIFLAVFLNSEIGQMLVDKYCSGSAQFELYPQDISKFLIWLAPKDFQEALANKIKKAYALRDEANKLLQESIAIIEKEIEKET